MVLAWVVMVLPAVVIEVGAVPSVRGFSELPVMTKVFSGVAKTSWSPANEGVPLIIVFEMSAGSESLYRDRWKLLYRLLSRRVRRRRTRRSPIHFF